MSEWVWLALGGLNLLGLLVLLFRAKAAPLAQEDKLAEQAAWQQQQFVAVAGSEFVGQLMLAVLQQDIDFITQQFGIQQADNHCSLLRPVEAPLNQFFSQIELCGETQLSSLTLQETNGNTTQITLQPEAGAQ